MRITTKVSCEEFKTLAIYSSSVFILLLVTPRRRRHRRCHPSPSSSSYIMGATDLLTLLFTHPNEFRVLAQFWLYHEQKRDITSASELATSGYDRSTMKRCWHFLDKTSRSFSSVIKELDGDLARVVRSHCFSLFFQFHFIYKYKVTSLLTSQSYLRFVYSTSSSGASILSKMT